MRQIFYDVTFYLHSIGPLRPQLYIIYIVFSYQFYSSSEMEREPQSCLCYQKKVGLVMINRSQVIDV